MLPFREKREGERETKDKKRVRGKERERGTELRERRRKVGMR